MSNDPHAFEATALADGPLPHARLTTESPLPGRIKLRAEDFLVEEIPLYDPVGEGEHLYLGVQKQGMSHSEMIVQLAKHFGVKEAAVGFAGMKDKVAVTRQQVSIYLPGVDPPTKPMSDPRIEIQWAARHGNKLRRGHLRGNRFSIRIRETDPLKAPLVLRMLRRLERVGVPNFYGFQRFGYRRNTHVLGRHVVREDPEALLAELLGATGSPFPERQRGAREAFDAGHFAQSSTGWSRSEYAERAALKVLKSGGSPDDAVRAINKHTLGFWVSALQSAIYNRLLEERLESGTLDAVELGDVAYKHDSRGQFLVDAARAADPELAGQVSGFEISPSGPMWGRRMLTPTDAVLTREHAAIEAEGVTCEQLESTALNERGSRRPYRFPVTNVEVDSGVDDHGSYIRTAFDLPRGAYATVLLREFIAGVDPE